MEANRPATKSQSSRKGKRSWRKNIDIDDIEIGLEEKRQELIQHGKAIDEIESSDLFIIDDEADEKITKKLKKDNLKPLKATEILNQRSKAPGLYVERSKRNSNKIQGVEKKEVHKLMKLAGRIDGESKLKESVNRDGIIKNKKAYDLWDEEEPEEPKSKSKSKPKKEIPDVLKKSSVISFTPATKLPSTMKVGPIRTRIQEKLPHGGKSYNPSFEKWQELINNEYFREKTKEDQKIALEEHHAKIQYLIEHLYDNELGSSGSEDEEEEEETHDYEEGLGLSINAPTVNKKKTKAQRNKEKRHKEKMALEQELKELKLKIKELDKLDEIKDAVDREEKEGEENKGKLTRKEQVSENKVLKKKKKLFKYTSIEEKVEVKLSDELNDSLRKLKPEGNHLYDQLRNLQDSGKIEARIGVKQKKKYSPKITEKWTYKDFK